MMGRRRDGVFAFWVHCMRMGLHSGFCLAFGLCFGHIMEEGDICIVRCILHCIFPWIRRRRITEQGIYGIHEEVDFWIVYYTASYHRQ